MRLFEQLSLHFEQLLIMKPPCQEHFKHSIPTQNSAGIDLFRPPLPRLPGVAIEGYNERINITFRFFRPDFAPSTIPRCRCNVPTVLRANQKGSRRRDTPSGEKKTERMKSDGMRYFWMCYAGAQDGGKGCGFLKILDMKEEGRGPLLGDRLG